MATPQDALLASQITQFIVRLVPQFHNLLASYKANPRNQTPSALGLAIAQDMQQFAPFLNAYTDLKTRNPTALNAAYASLGIDPATGDGDVTSLQSAIVSLKNAPKGSHPAIGAASDTAAQTAPRYESLF